MGRHLCDFHRSGTGVFQALVLLAAIIATPAISAELIVVDQANCPYCERFEREIAPAWPKTDEGRNVPLRRVSLHADWPADLSVVERATLTPTFILVENGEEQGRLVGYAGDEHFWFLIGELLESSSAREQAPETVAIDDTVANGSTKH